jgi:hypothetical protein
MSFGIEAAACDNADRSAKLKQLTAKRIVMIRYRIRVSLASGKISIFLSQLHDATALLMHSHGLRLGFH